MTKKLALKLTADSARALDHLLTRCIRPDNGLPPAEKCALSLLQRWHYTKLKRLTSGPDAIGPGEQRKLKLDATLGWAIAHFIETMTVPIADPYTSTIIGNLYGDIDQTFFLLPSPTQP